MLSWKRRHYFEEFLWNEWWKTTGSHRDNRNNSQELPVLLVAFQIEWFGFPRIRQAPSGSWPILFKWSCAVPMCRAHVLWSEWFASHIYSERIPGKVNIGSWDVLPSCKNAMDLCHSCGWRTHRENGDFLCIFVHLVSLRRLASHFAGNILWHSVVSCSQDALVIGIPNGWSAYCFSGDRRNDRFVVLNLFV